MPLIVIVHFKFCIRNGKVPKRKRHGNGLVKGRRMHGTAYPTDFSFSTIQNLNDEQRKNVLAVTSTIAGACHPE